MHKAYFALLFIIFYGTYFEGMQVGGGGSAAAYIPPRSLIHRKIKALCKVVNRDIIEDFIF